MDPLKQREQAPVCKHMSNNNLHSSYLSKLMNETGERFQSYAVLTIEYGRRMLVFPNLACYIRFVNQNETSR